MTRGTDISRAPNAIAPNQATAVHPLDQLAVFDLVDWWLDSSTQGKDDAADYITEN
jgi:hypothetical protein